MGTPTLTTVHVSAALGNVAIGYKPTSAVLASVAPVVTVTKESDYYHIWTQADIYRNEAEIVRPGSGPRGGFALSSTTYTAESYEFAWPIPDRIRNNLDQASARS